MKNYIKKVVFLSVGILAFLSCEDNDITTLSENDPVLIQFSQTSLNLATPESGASVEVEVTVSSKSSVDRVVNVEVSDESTALQGQYAVGDLVVPANSYSGTMEITGNFEALPEEGSTTLNLNIVDIEGNGESLVNNGTLEVTLFRRCSIVLEDLVGSWSGTDSWGYPTTFETYMDNGKLMMKGGLLYDWIMTDWDEPIIDEAPVELNVNLETFEVSIPDQYYVSTTYQGVPQPEYKLRGSGMIVNSCEGIMELYPVLVQPELTITGSAYGPLFAITVTLAD